MYKIILITLLLYAASCQAQNKQSYKEVEICTDSVRYKGKKNHGKFHCSAEMVVREYQDGRKDTIALSGETQLFIEDEYEKYKNLSERGKYIIDSLKEDGIPMFQDSYLTYEPMYMKGKEVYKSWIILGQDVRIYYYSLWNNSKGIGFSLTKEIIVK